jgi:subtilisin-like proprotein convertase family protein
VGGLALAGISPAAATVPQGNGITIPDSGLSAPYPSTIVVSGESGTITDVNVRLSGIVHTFSADLEVVLVSPTGQKIALMNDNGGSSPYNSANLTFDDQAATTVPNAVAASGGTFRPSNASPGQSLPAPAPAGPYASTLAVVNGLSPNGTWQLFVNDDASGDQGSVASWDLQLTLSGAGAIIPDLGVSGPYPSQLKVSNLQGVITDVNVTLTGLTHTFPFDLNIVLVSPSGTPLALSGRVGGGHPGYFGANLIFDDQAPGPVPDPAPVGGGAFRPTTEIGGSLSAPGPQGPYAGTLSAFNGQSPNGLWSLFIDDQAAGDSGSLGSWSITLVTAQPVVGGSTQVSVTATTPTATEGGADGALTFTRSGDKSGSININYALSGTATSADVSPLGTVHFAPNDTTVVVPVHAIADHMPEGQEILTVSVNSGGGYTPRAPTSADITINDGSDPCTGAPAANFTDVPASDVHKANVDCIAHLGLAHGGPEGQPATHYGPTLNTSRGQIASFVARMLISSGVSLPASPPNAFDDDNGDTHEMAINQLAAIGVIHQNGDETASFLNNAHQAAAGAKLTSTKDAFTDDDGNPFEADINALTEVSVIQGKSPGIYDPAGPVPRDQMASFLVRFVQLLANEGHFPS